MKAPKLAVTVAGAVVLVSVQVLPDVVVQPARLTKVDPVNGVAVHMAFPAMGAMGGVQLTVPAVAGLAVADRG